MIRFLTRLCSALLLLGSFESATAKGLDVEDSATDSTCKYLSAQPDQVPSLSVLESPTHLYQGAPISIAIDASGDAELLKCLILSPGVTLFVDNLPFSTQLLGARAERKRIVLDFRFRFSKGDEASWRELYAREWEKPNSRSSLGIGFANKLQIATIPLAAPDTVRVGYIPLGFLRHFAAATGIAALIFFCALLSSSWLALEKCFPFDTMKRSPLLRDRGKSSASAEEIRKIGSSYSLSRILFAAWLLTALVCVAVSYSISGSLPSVSDRGIAFLLLASGLTTAASTAVDFVRDTEPPISRGFWHDVTTDRDGGVSLPRIQALAVNAIVLGVYWYGLVTQGTVADVDSGWAAFISISNSTYVAAKSVEANSSAYVETESS